MSARFHRALPVISIFHKPTLPTSQRALAALQRARTPTGVNERPIDFDLEINEHPPTPTQINNIINFLPASQQSLSALIDEHGANGAPPARASELEKRPEALHYPLVVNWDEGTATTSEEGVADMIERLRSGMAKNQNEGKPKGWFGLT